MKNILQKLSPCKNTPQLYKNPIVTTPILLGVFRPAIILPDKTYEDITNATILIICQEKNPGSEMKNGIQTLVSEKLALDAQDIRIDYLDVETFTSPDTQDIYLD